MVRKENKDLIGRLENNKFTSALQYLEGEGDEVVYLVKALAAMVGDVGYLDGDLGLIIGYAVMSILPEIEEVDAEQ